MAFFNDLQVRLEESPFAARTLVFIVLSALTGSGLLYVITEYAIYFYLLSHGVWPAFEGVSFLPATVALFGLCFSIATSLIYIGVRILISSLIDSLFGSAQVYTGIFGEALSGTKYGERFESSLKKITEAAKTVRLVRVSRLMIFLLMCALAVWAFFWITGVSLGAEGKMGFSILCALFVLSVLTIWRKNISWYIGGVSAAASFVYFVGIVTDFDNLAAQLRALQYGGGIDIEATYSGSSEKENMKLLLRTKTSLIGEKNEAGEFMEILLDSVSKIKYLPRQIPSDE